MQSVNAELEHSIHFLDLCGAEVHDIEAPIINSPNHNEDEMFISSYNVELTIDGPVSPSASQPASPQEEQQVSITALPDGEN